MHQCLVIRHGAAEESAVSGNDAERALTPAGVEQMRAVAAGLAAIGRAPAEVLTSPYRRARETGDIVAGAFGAVPVVEETTLASGASAADILVTLAGRLDGNSGSLAVVGHEPDLGRFVSYALAASARGFISLRKGSACLLEFPATPRAGNATLEWALDPEHLAAVAAHAGPA